MDPNLKLLAIRKVGDPEEGAGNPAQVKASEMVGILPRSVVSLALASRRHFRIRYRHAHIGMYVPS